MGPAPPIPTTCAAFRRPLAQGWAKPKQAMFTHNNILFSERSYTADLDLTPDDVMWMPSPLNHATGFYHGTAPPPMLTGSRCVLQLHFKAAGAIELINREHVTRSARRHAVRA